MSWWVITIISVNITHRYGEVNDVNITTCLGYTDFSETSGKIRKIVNPIALICEENKYINFNNVCGMTRRIIEASKMRFLRSVLGYQIRRGLQKKFLVII